MGQDFYKGVRLEAKMLFFLAKDYDFSYAVNYMNQLHIETVQNRFSQAQRTKYVLEHLLQHHPGTFEQLTISYIQNL